MYFLFKYLYIYLSKLLYVYTLTVIILTTFTNGCEYQGYSISDENAKACKKLDIVCSDDSERWDNAECGCGCKPS